MTAVAELEAGITEYRQVLFAAALHMTKQYQDAEDLVQETFLKAYARIEQYQPGTNLRGWLYTILKTTYINIYRKRQRQPQEAWLGASDDLLKESVMESANPEPSAEDVALHDVPGPVMEALKDIPEDFRETAYLAFVADYSYREIAEMTDKPIGTVMSRLHRARSKVKNKLGEAA